MPYKTELHCHSDVVSMCGHISPEELVEHYLAADYTTVVLTEHLSRHTFHPGYGRYKGEDNWQRKIDFYMQGYHRLKEAAGDRLHILWGVEYCLNHNYTDYLLYGATEEFLRESLDIMDRDVQTLSETVRGAGVLFYQAHPFRNEITVTNPKLLDGIEVYNAHFNHCSRNDIAELWAKRFGLLEISGSDTHETKNVLGGGILTDTPITTNEELVATLRNGNYSLIRGGTPKMDPVK